MTSRKAASISVKLSKIGLFINRVVETWWLPGVEEDILGCRNPGSAGCNLAESSGVCAGWTHYLV